MESLSWMTSRSSSSSQNERWKPSKYISVRTIWNQKSTDDPLNASYHQLSPLFWSSCVILELVNGTCWAGILVSCATAFRSLDMVPDKGTATPTLIQLEHFPWYTTVTYSGLQHGRTAVNGLFRNHSCRKTTSNFSFLLSDLSWCLSEMGLSWMCGSIWNRTSENSVSFQIYFCFSSD